MLSQIAKPSPQGGRINVQYRRVQCAPPSNIVVSVTNNRGGDGWIQLDITVLFLYPCTSDIAQRPTESGCVLCYNHCQSLPASPIRKGDSGLQYQLVTQNPAALFWRSGCLATESRRSGGSEAGGGAQPGRGLASDEQRVRSLLGAGQCATAASRPAHHG